MNDRKREYRATRTMVSRQWSQQRFSNPRDRWVIPNTPVGLDQDDAWTTSSGGPPTGTTLHIKLPNGGAAHCRSVSIAASAGRTSMCACGGIRRFQLGSSWALPPRDLPPSPPATLSSFSFFWLFFFQPAAVDTVAKVFYLFLLFFSRPQLLLLARVTLDRGIIN